MYVIDKLFRLDLQTISLATSLVASRFVRKHLTAVQRFTAHGKGEKQPALLLQKARSTTNCL